MICTWQKIRTPFTFAPKIFPTKYGIGKAFYEAFIAFEEKNKKGNEDEQNDTNEADFDGHIRGALQNDP